MLFILTGGGTAGHINPALAMAQMLRRAYPDATFYFMGKKDGLEYSLAKKANIPFIPIRAMGLKRSLSPRNIKAAFLALSEPYRLKKMMRALSPAAVIGTGGYVCYPVIKAAHMLGIPCFLHESNAIPGLAVKLCEKMATRIFLQFPDAMRHLRYPDKALAIGAPLRDGFEKADCKRARQRLGISQRDFFVLSFGGSIGAEGLNDACIAFMQKAEKRERDIRCLHGCGARCYEDLKKRFTPSSSKMALLPYINDMNLYMAAADLVIARAGAITLSELSALAKPSILIPSPFVANDHQRKNALLFQEKGASIMIEEEALSADLLLDKVLYLKASPHLLSKMSNAACKIFSFDTERLFLKEMKNILGV